MTASGTWPSVIVHADMDAFYAAVEQLDDPRLRGKPILVGPNSGRGVVLTASYEARPAKVGSAMPMAIARRRCPDAIVVPPRFDRYREISRIVMRVFADFSPVVEPISLDEAFLDMTGSAEIFGDPQSIGVKLKAAVKEATGGLTVSVGISGTKYVAKVASGYAKPDGLTIIPPEAARAWLAGQPVARLWGAGPKTQARLAELGLETIGDLAAYGEVQLEAALGRAGSHFYALSQARDPRRVESRREAKSLSSERTLVTDVALAELQTYARDAANTVARRMRSQGQAARGVRVKVKTHDFRILTRQRRLPAATHASDVIYAAAQELLTEFEDPGPFRLIGVAAYEIGVDESAAQLDLLDQNSGRGERLDTVLDAVQEKFGPGTVLRAVELLNQTVFTDDLNLDYLDDELDKSN